MGTPTDLPWDKKHAMAAWQERQEMRKEILRERAKAVEQIPEAEWQEVKG